MITNININRQVIIFISLILLSSFFISCSGIKPPGYHNEKFISKKNNKDISSESIDNEIENNTASKEFDDEQLSKLKEFEEKVINSQKEEKPELEPEVNIIQPDEVVAGEPIIYEDELTIEEEPKIDFSERLSTLDNQLTEITSRQDITDNKIEKMQKNITTLENKISEIESKINKENTMQPVNSDSHKKKNEFIIKPDEKVNKGKTVKVSYTKTEPLIENSQDKNKFEAGIKYFNAEKYSLAIQTLKGIENIDNTDLSNPVNYYIAKSYYNTGDFSSALTHLSKIISNSEVNYQPEAHFLIAECYIKSGKADKAKETYREFVTIYPANKFTPQARKMLQKL